MLDKWLKEIREKISCPQLSDDHYGEWGILTKKQRFTIKRMLDFIESQEEYIRNLQEENERLNNSIDEQEIEIARLYKEIERLSGEISKARRKALLEAMSKFAGHSDYHGDTILCKLVCMAEGKEVGNAKPLDMSKIKAEAYKEFAEKIYATTWYHINKNGELVMGANSETDIPLFKAEDVFNLLKEFGSGDNV